MNKIRPQDLIHFRKRIRISQGRLAVQTGVSSFVISQFEQNKGRLTDDENRILMRFMVEKCMELL